MNKVNFAIHFLILIGLPFSQNEKWIEVKGAMSVARSEGGVALIDGLMYFPGGYNNSASVMNTLEAYDPKNDSWKRLKDMPEALEHHVVHGVNGKMYVFKAKTHIYDPSSDSWSEGKSTARRDDPTSVVVGDDVYIVGGGRPDLQKYNTTNDTWSDLSPMDHEVGHARAAHIDGKIYITGGIPGATNRQTSDVFVYDIGQDNWSKGVSMKDVRSGHSIGVIDGKIIVAGGELGSPRSIITSVEIFDPSTSQWSYLPEMPTGLHGTGYTVYENKLYILGGSKVPYWVDNDGTGFILDMGILSVDWQLNNSDLIGKIDLSENGYNLKGQMSLNKQINSENKGKARNLPLRIVVDHGKIQLFPKSKN